MSQCKSEVSELLQLVRQLKHENEEKDKRILLVESCIDDLEQYTRMDDVIISGLKTNHKSYTRAGSPSLDYTNGPLAPQGELENLESCVTRFFQDQMGVDLSGDDITACHTLPGRKDIPDISIRLTNRKTKTLLLQNSRRLKNAKIFVNEHLTKKNARTASEARRLRRDKKIMFTWTRNCKVFIKTFGSPEAARVVHIKDISDLAKILQ